MTNINFEVQGITIVETLTTSKGVIVNLCKTLQGATGSYVNAATWNKEDIETCKHYLKEGDCTKRLGDGHGFSEIIDGIYTQHGTSKGNIDFVLSGPSFILTHHKIPRKPEEVILYMDYDFFNAGKDVRIRNGGVLEELANSYKEFLPAPKELGPMPKALRKAYGRQLARGEITKAKFDEIASQYAPLETAKPQETVDQAKTQVKEENTDTFVGEIGKKIAEAFEKIDLEAFAANEAHDNAVNSKLATDIANLRIAAEDEKQRHMTESLKKTNERKEVTKKAIIQRAMEALQSI